MPHLSSKPLRAVAALLPAAAIMLAHADAHAACRDAGEYVVCEAPPGADIRLFHADASGAVYGDFARVEADLAAQGERLVFAMNAGMYHKDRAPVGALIIDGKRLRGAQAGDGPGNFHLKPNPIAVTDCSVAAEDFHARFSATGRAYLYRIANRRAPPVLERGRVWWVPAELDAAAMHAAAQRLIGHHDFTTFRAAICQAQSPLKSLDRLDVNRIGEEIQVIAEARSFLHHQVRNRVGTLRLVGDGKWSADDVTAALEARDRAAGGPTAPPDELYLTRVVY